MADQIATETPEEAEANTSHIYDIPDPNFGHFKSRIAKMAKRAERLGLSEFGFRELGTSFRKLSGSGKDSPSIQVHHIEVWGARPNIRGWRFCGKLEHVPGTNDVLVKEMNDGDVPANFRQCDPNCDHCKTTRNRRDTFVIRNGVSGEYMQIGRSCLSDYFGGKDAETIAAYFEFMQEGREILQDLEAWDGDGLSSSNLYHRPDRVLAFAAAAVREDGGYISARDAEARGVLSTGQLVRANLTVPEARLSKSERIVPQEQDRQRAGEILAWLQSAAVAEREETYFHNLRVMAGSEGIGVKNIGLFASAVAAYDRERSRQLEGEAAGSSRYLGKPGEKIELVVKLTGTTVIPGDRFGDKLLHRFLDDQGNALVWFATGAGQDMDIGHTYHIKATVKEHSEYRGIAQTTVERVTCPDMKLFAHVENYDGDLKAFVKKLKMIQDIDVRESRRGATPLFKAIMWGLTDVAKELIKAGATLDITDKHGITTRAICQETYDLVRSESLARGWLDPREGTAYGTIGCEADNLGILAGFGIGVGTYDSVAKQVPVEVPPEARDHLRQFQSDFEPSIIDYDGENPVALREFCRYFLGTSPNEELRALWTGRFELLSSPPPSPAPARNPSHSKTLAAPLVP